MLSLLQRGGYCEQGHHRTPSKQLESQGKRNVLLCVSIS